MYPIQEKRVRLCKFPSIYEKFMTCHYFFLKNCKFAYKRSMIIYDKTLMFLFILHLLKMKFFLYLQKRSIVLYNYFYIHFLSYAPLILEI